MASEKTTKKLSKVETAIAKRENAKKPQKAAPKTEPKTS